MQTTNTRLLNPEENKKYYSQSDHNYIDPAWCTKAHMVLDRCRWVREQVNKLGSSYHFDVGCKDGYLDLTLASEGVECIAIDPSVDAIDEAKLRAKERGITNAKFMVATIEEVGTGFMFDTASMCEVIEHVVDPDLAVVKLAKMSRFFMITTPDANGRHGMEDSQQNEEHVRMFTQEELFDLCKKYGEVLECAVRDDAICILCRSTING